MNTTNRQKQRQTAIHLLRSGRSPSEVAQQLRHSIGWVYKWQNRYDEAGWSGLADQSRAPKQHGTAYPETVRQAICQARSKLEAKAAAKTGLRYVGSTTVQAELEKEGKAVPSTATIERVLRAAGMVNHSAVADDKPKVKYPHLQPTAPHQLCQVDIAPHYLRGGKAVACFNAIDVVSRYPTGQPMARRRSQDAAEFLLHTWQEIGLPHYTQVDNEGCFSGGATHAGVLGKVVRLALQVGTELLFSPFYHPKSNCTVERFHQDYDLHVWDETELPDIPGVKQLSDRFFADYRHSTHHSALKKRTPSEVHHQTPPTLLSADFTLTDQKLPLTEGRVHFLRQVSPAGTVKVLNLQWTVPEPDVTKGVWVTIDFKVAGATLRIYDAAPDAVRRTCLAVYPFPLKEEVIPRPAKATTQKKLLITRPATSRPVSSINIGTELFISTVYYTAKIASRFLFTMY